MLMAFGATNANVPGMRNALLISLVILFSASLAAAEDIPAQLVDRSIRYVNGRVITLGDLIDNLRTNRPQNLPNTRAGELELWRTSLKAVTDETLLVLFAEEKGVSLDRAQISKRVLDDLKRSGRLATPDEIVKWRDQLERREMIRAALSFFDMRSGNVTPDDLSVAYTDRSKQFFRPARSHVLQFVLRAASSDEITKTTEDATALFRRFQEHAGPIADTAATYLDRLLAVASDEVAKRKLLRDVVAAIAALPDDGLNAAAKGTRDDAKALVKRTNSLKTRDDVEAAVSALREQLLQGDEAAFRAAVIAQSEGPRRDDGGDLGWVERGNFTEAFDQAAFTGPIGAPGEMFWVGEACCLTWVTEREEQAQRSFAEVCGELESVLRRERSDAVFARAVRILRARATIRDLATVDELLGN
jgi:hypothetical protein